MRKQLLAILALFIAGPAYAQFAADDRLEPPRSPAEYWRAINFEINTGKYDAAAFYLKGFLAASPSDQDFLELEQKDGLASFLRLRNITWSSDAKANGEAKKLVEEAISKVNTALEKHLGNQQRINRLIATLHGSDDERQFAIRELQRTGARSIPALITALRADADPEHRAAILNLLPLLPEDTVPPLLAALDMSDARVRYMILDSLGMRGDFANLPARPLYNPLPTLHYLAASPKQPADIRNLATTLITRLRPMARTALPPAKVELTEAAMKYFRHQERFINPEAIPIWRWENDDLTLTMSTLTQAEEYFGLRYARWALDLDPEYLPAQVAFLSIAVDKAFGRAGAAADLTKVEPAVHDLLATAGPSALIAAMDQAMIDRQTNVVLGIAQILGERADGKAAQAGRSKPAVLIQALSYPDRRVQLAAATALLRIPGPFAQQNQTKIVEILRRALAAESEVSTTAAPRILVAHFDAMAGKEIAAMLKEVGYDVVSVRTGREALNRLRQAGDINAVIVDSEIAYPQLTDLLATLRGDTFARALPVIVLSSPAERATYPSVRMEAVLKRTTPQTELLRHDEERTAHDDATRLRFIAEGQPRVALLRAPLTPAVLKTALEKSAVDDGAPLSAEERKRHAVAAAELFRQIAQGNSNIDLKPAGRAIRQALKTDDIGMIVVDVVGRLPGKEAQVDLASLVLDENRPEAIRLAGARNLAAQIQRFGPALPKVAVEALIKLAQQTKEPQLRGQVAAVVGVLTGEGKNTGARLQGYQAPKPGVAAKEPAADDKKPEPKPEKKPDPDDE